MVRERRTPLWFSESTESRRPLPISELVAEKAMIQVASMLDLQSQRYLMTTMLPDGSHHQKAVLSAEIHLTWGRFPIVPLL